MTHGLSGERPAFNIKCGGRKLARNYIDPTWNNKRESTVATAILNRKTDSYTSLSLRSVPFTLYSIKNLAASDCYNMRQGSVYK